MRLRRPNVSAGALVRGWTMKRIAATAFMIALSSSHAFAANPVAQLDVMSGKVLVDQGQGFVAATKGLSINAGDRILVGEEGSADIRYLKAECVISIAPASVMSVQANAPCLQSETTASIDSAIIAPASVTGAVAGANYAYFVVPAFVAAVGSAMTWQVIEEKRNDNDLPVSAP